MHVRRSQERTGRLAELAGQAGRQRARGRTFWSAWSAFAGSESYAETVIKAIRYGSDTDTTAAVAGGLAGTLWGIGDIPAEWLSAMRGHEIVEPLVVQLLAAARPSPRS